MRAPFQRVICQHSFVLCRRFFNSKVVLGEVLKNPELFRQNLVSRKSKVSVDEIIKLSQDSTKSSELEGLLKRLPNHTYPAVQNLVSPLLIEHIGDQNVESCSQNMQILAKGQGLLVQGKEYTTMCGERSYFLTGDLVRLEHALIQYTLDKLKSLNFKLVSVPDIITSEQVEGCGMKARGQRSQVYHLNFGSNKDLCLSGTSEISLANLFKNKDIKPSDLPLKLCAVSRCYRAEISTIKEEKGLYRVHQFTKVEMFGITKGNIEESQKLLLEFADIQKSIFRELGLNFKVLDMPPNDLGKPAYRKIDIEAWLDGHAFYGELSSASDCTTFQSNRLQITSDGNLTHTVNGTACAVPRMLIALTETHRGPRGTFLVPEVLQSYMKGKTSMRAEKNFKRWTRLPYYFLENKFMRELITTDSTQQIQQ